jgi:hypothetical protein
MKAPALLLLSLLAAAPAFACKPAPLGECEKSARVRLRAPALKKLTEKVNSFQKHLTASLQGVPKEGQSSCFNNNFAPHYVAGVKEYAAKHRNFFCPAHLDRVDETVKAMINADSPEMKAVKNPADQEKLQGEAKEVLTALDKFIGAHNM